MHEEKNPIASVRSPDEGEDITYPAFIARSRRGHLAHATRHFVVNFAFREWIPRISQRSRRIWGSVPDGDDGLGYLIHGLLGRDTDYDLDYGTRLGVVLYALYAYILLLVWNGTKPAPR